MSERSELRSRREERMEMAFKIRLGARLFSKTFPDYEFRDANRILDFSPEKNKL
jgi:hypothetical protein